MITYNQLTGLFFMLGFAILIIIISTAIRRYFKEGFQNSSAYKQDKEYTAQVKLLSDKYSADANGKRPVTAYPDTDMPQEERAFVNYYALGCRFTGYLGPMNNGYYDVDIGVQTAVNAGCRVFVLEIDYIDSCETDVFYPRITIRDSQGKLAMNRDSIEPLCNSAQASSIRDVCDKINFYAFSSCQNNTDPVVVVLYFVRQPPGAYNSKVVLDFFANVAKSLSPLKDRLLKNEINGGTYYRQKQEGQLLINNLDTYNDKVLIFSNANTNGFREMQYPINEDLDYMVNLRLSYTQQPLGVTENKTSSLFGILDTTDSYMIIPDNKVNDTIEQTKLRWTICFSKDPSVTVPLETYKTIATKFGVHCIPAVLFDDASSFMFTDSLFKRYSFLPKPAPLRYKKPAVVTPAEPSNTTDAKGGSLREPTI